MTVNNASSNDSDSHPDQPSEAEWSAPDSRTMVCRGVRGATTVEANDSTLILEATRDLLERLIAANQIDPEDVASVWFTTTPDLTAEYPAVAARQLGWHDSALMCSHEMAVPHGLARCIRVLIHWNTARRLTEIEHVYIRGAVNLRPDRHKIRAQPVPNDSVSPSVPSASSTVSTFNHSSNL